MQRNINIHNILFKHCILDNVCTDQENYRVRAAAVTLKFIKMIEYVIPGDRQANQRNNTKQKWDAYKQSSNDGTLNGPRPYHGQR